MSKTLSDTVGGRGEMVASIYRQLFMYASGCVIHIVTAITQQYCRCCVCLPHKM